MDQRLPSEEFDRAGEQSHDHHGVDEEDSIVRQQDARHFQIFVDQKSRDELKQVGRVEQGDDEDGREQEEVGPLKRSICPTNLLTRSNRTYAHISKLANRPTILPGILRPLS